MSRTIFWEAILCAALGLSLSGCGSKVKADPSSEAPPPANVERAPDGNLVKVDRPEQFPLATAAERDAAPETNATGVVNADVSRTIPVISLASGRIVEIDARLGDTVKKGQLLLKVQSPDIAQAFADYQHSRMKYCRGCNSRDPRPCTTKGPPHRRIWRWRRAPKTKPR
jgi:cobalt-zinc-cadmium efflux system membrane fusion protein